MAPNELRCPNGIKFGELTTEFIEVKCRSRRCGAQPGVVVIHRFDHQGSFIGTKQYRDPAFREEVKNDATRNQPSLRSA
jgi:hypothetical protein